MRIAFKGIPMRAYRMQNMRPEVVVGACHHDHEDFIFKNVGGMMSRMNPFVTGELYDWKDPHKTTQAETP